MSNLPDPRRAAFELVAATVAAGLPVPRYVHIGADDDVSRATTLIQLADDDRNGVNWWAGHLDLPRPDLGLTPLRSEDRWWQPFESIGCHPVTGRTVWVKSHVTVPAPAGIDSTEATR